MFPKAPALTAHGNDARGQVLKRCVCLTQLCAAASDGGQLSNRNTQFVDNRVSDNVVDDHFQRGHVSVANLIVGHLCAEEVVGEQLEHDWLDLRFELHAQRFILLLEKVTDRSQSLAHGATKCLLELVELFGLIERRFAEGWSGELLLSLPAWTIGVQQRVATSRPGNAYRRQRVAIELAGLVARLGEYGANHVRVARHQHWRETGYIEVAIMSARPLFLVSLPEVGVENSKRFAIVPRMRKGQRRPTRFAPEQRHARRLNGALKRADATQLTWQSLQSGQTRDHDLLALQHRTHILLGMRRAGRPIAAVHGRLGCA